MFAVKYEVQGLADQLARNVKQADDTERDIRVLDAEWAYLNRPDALAQMNQRFLSLAPIATKQLRTSLADIPMRPAPPAAGAGRDRRRRSADSTGVNAADRIRCAGEAARPACRGRGPAAKPAIAAAGTARARS